MAGYIGSRAVSVNTTSATLTDDLTIGDDLTVTDDMTVGGTLGVTGVLTATSLDISGDIDVDGTANLDVVDIDGAVDMASTLAVAGVVTANAGVVVDNFTLDGTTLALSSGNMTIDVAGNISLDADDSGQVRFKDGGTEYISIYQSSSDAVFQSSIQDKDILFKGNDGGSTITALTLDMSNGGTATFRKKIIVSAADGVADADSVGSFANLEGTSGRSFGVSIQAGSSGSDIALNVGNTAGDTTLMRVHGNGTTTIANSLTLTDGNLVVASGHGIDFSAETTDAGGMENELLAEYETGTFTMALGMASASAFGIGRYVKVGRLVHFQWYSGGTINVDQGAGAASFSGLPFITDDDNGSYGTFSSSHNTYAPTAANGYLTPNSNVGVFTALNTTGGAPVSTGTGKYVMVAGTYRSKV